MSRRTALLAAAILISPALATAAEAPKVTVNGTVDSYYTLNLTNAQDYTSPTNGVVGLTGFNFNYAKVGTVAESGPATLKLDLVYGPMGQSVSGLPPGQPPTNITRLFVQQALVALKFERFTVEAGRFVSPRGFEVYEAKDNWLYSHGLLFSFAKPTAHEGVRVFIPVSSELTAVAALANGSDLFTNDVGISQSPYKTLILGGAFARENNTASVYLFISKDPVTTEDAFLLDGTYTRTMGPTSFNVSADFGKLGSSSWLGVGGSVKHALAPDGVKIVGRVEYLKDDDAIHTGLIDPADGTGVGLFSLTGGVNYPVGSNAELRAELRLDRASAKVYGVTDPSETMATFTAAALAWF